MNAPRSETDPSRHSANIRRMLIELSRHAREDAGKVSEPKAQALFETTAEVLQGLARAYDHYHTASEAAWK